MKTASVPEIRSRRAPVGVLDLVGRTPLVRLPRVAAEIPGALVAAKAEWMNPGGSVKDRPALRMVLEGLRRGALGPGKRILDATSGNTGIAYAMIGAALGYGVTLCLPRNASPERARILRGYGAEIVPTDPLDGTDGAIREARRIAAAHPDRFFYADQYSNPANWEAHYHGTAMEILEQTGGRLTHFVAGLGTSGTFIGVARRLREEAPHVRLVSVEPDGPWHGIEGLKHMASSIVPAIYDPALADDRRAVSTEAAYAMTRKVLRDEGLRAGVSSGAALVAALDVAREAVAAGGRPYVVTVFPDGADKYLSDRFWEEP